MKKSDDHQLLNMHGINKSFSGNTVLNKVDFSLHSGEILALLGANGAGKSTLMKILTGVYTQDAGEITIENQPVTIRQPIDSIEHGIRFVPQELSIMPDLSVGENIFQGQLPLKNSILRQVDFKSIFKKSDELLHSLGINDISSTTFMRKLTVPEQRIVEIARALVGEAKILILDEPTASLAETESRKLFTILENLRLQKIGIIFISHYLDEVFELSDRITVLRDGCISGEYITSKTDHDTVLKAMIGKDSKKLYPPFGKNIGSEILSLRNVSNDSLLKDVNLTLNQGEIHGVFGLLGSGIEELGKAIFGANPSQGEFIFQGNNFNPKSITKTINAGIGYVAAERKSEGLVLTMMVRENVTLPFLEKYLNITGVNTQKEKKNSEKWIEKLKIKTTGSEQNIGNLSGGNQQKVCISRWLEDDLKVLILEEPTRGVDLGAREDIYQHLRNLTEQGLSIIIISSDCEEIAGLCDQMTILHNGVSVGCFGAATDPHKLAAKASGL